MNCVETENRYNKIILSNGILSSCINTTPQKLEKKIKTITIWTQMNSLLVVNEKKTERNRTKQEQ